MIIGVCIRAKNEEKIICDWVNYYIKLGFDKIIIYDNNSSPSLEETLKEKELLDDPKVQIILDTNDGNNQHIIYQECINNNKELDWLLLCDTDEFIYIKDGTIKDFLNGFSEDTSTILINWIVYGTGCNKKYDRTKTIFEQFTKRENYTHFWNIFPKSFIRPKLIEKFGNVHITCNLNKYKVKNVYNEIVIPINYPSNCEYPDKVLSENTPLVMVHYMTLDIESMLEKKIKNRKYDLLDDRNNKYTLEWYKSHYYGFRDNNEDMRMLKFVYIR